MSQFRKKPVVIEAFKWTGGPDQIEDPIWIVEAIKRGDVYFEKFAPQMYISTLEGVMRADVGDYVIQGVKGEIYPCKPDIFAATYDVADAKHEGLPVAGYKPQNQSAVDAVNANKREEEILLRRLDVMRVDATVDGRWLAIARTSFEQAYMALNRSIFRPSRAKLAEDEANG